MALYDHFKDLPLAIEAYELERHQLAVSSGFDRVTTEIVLRGGGHTGRGEDVTYDTLDHDALLHSAHDLPLIFNGSFDQFSRHLDAISLWPAPPTREVSDNYRRWAFESAALDLALRQAGTSFDRVIGVKPRPVRFILSLRLGDPPTIAPVEAWLKYAPWLQFKLDAERSWPTELIQQLAKRGVVESVDLKGLYVGTVVDNPPDPRLYRDVVKLFSTAWIEDPAIVDETRAIIEPAIDRVTWDAPIHSVADIEALAHHPRCLNIKPSRFGPLRELLAAIEYCQRNAIAMYSGGQFELAVGRTHLHVLASVFFPDSANDAAPVAYHVPEPVPDAPSSPLTPPDNRAGFSWSP